MIEIIGFTGSRKGMTGDQAAEVTRFLIKTDVEEAHHGDCVGADEQFHLICQGLGIRIVIHPPDKDIYRAFCRDADQILRPKPYVERNHDIVKACTILVATPAETQEPRNLRGHGTWATVAFARNDGCSLLVVPPQML